MDLSVLLPVYRGDDPDHLKTSITSIAEQTYSPEQVVVVRDGPLPAELNLVIDDWSHDNSVPMTCVSLSENIGLGGALREGLKHCEGEFTARMDSDDRSVPRRFEKQMKFLRSNPDVDILGGYIAEFDSNLDYRLEKREVPLDDQSIKSMARFRCPFNHATVVMRTDCALQAGNYRSVDYMEDWDLWSRMLRNGATTANLPEVLLHVRAGEELYSRRGGIGYAKSEYARQAEFLRRNFISRWEFIRNLALRVPARLVPDRARSWIYRSYLRK